MRGRKPKPIQRQIAEGDPRRHGVNKLDAALNAIPQAEKGLPRCPSNLGPIAKYAWNFWKAELEKMDMAFRPDRMALEGACVHYERAKIADKIVQDKGVLIVEVLTDREGKPTGQKKVRRNPALAVSTEAWRGVRSFCSEFGLSPIGRQRLAMEAADTSHDDLIALLEGPRLTKESVN